MGTAANDVPTPLRQRYFYWDGGCLRAAHAASFFSVSYFDQMISAYYLVIGSTVLAATARRRRGHIARTCANRGSSSRQHKSRPIACLHASFGLNSQIARRRAGAEGGEAFSDLG